MTKLADVVAAIEQGKAAHDEAATGSTAIFRDGGFKLIVDEISAAAFDAAKGLSTPSGSPLTGRRPGSTSASGTPTSSAG